MPQLESPLEVLRKNIRLLTVAVGLVGASYVTIDKVTAHDSRLTRIETKTEALELELALYREREKAAVIRSNEVAQALEGVQKALGSLQIMMSKVCYAVSTKNSQVKCD